MTAVDHATSRTADEPRSGHRCVQWATGNIGSRALRGIIGHPSLQLAGVYVTSAEKVGVDAGVLAGTSTTGVTATDRIDDIIALRPDCVLYMPAVLDVDDVERLLRSGINVVTTRVEFHRPRSMDPVVRERIERACRDGGASIHSTGSSPGFITEALPMTLLSLQRHVDEIRIDEYADLSERNSPDLLFGIMGFGQHPAAFDQGRLEHLRASFGPSLQLLAESVGLTVDTIEVSGEVATVGSAVSIAAGMLESGTVGAQRITVCGCADGRPVVRFRPTWYCTEQLDSNWDLLPTGWRIRVDGDAPLSVDIRMPLAPEDLAETTPGYTANRAVNAVAHVCAAPPGIRTSLDLPQFVPEFA
ncbi:dihydrodipicolinate reductase [Gordonia sp. LSe1-13]|uniref:Dihydrodipicolinate reductase n=1 Tax=Gordonia sesuvii TaxID=3116777 RepID=A0ABU7M8S3_9ACTN|nr:dihydrodipicolinate reductase [Gordonia sp. LSe1-13]